MSVAEWIIWLQKLGSEWSEYNCEWEKERGKGRNEEIGWAVSGYNNTNSQAMGDALQIYKIALVIFSLPPTPQPFTLSFCVKHSVSKSHSLPHKITFCNNWLVKLIIGLTNSGLNEWNVLSVNYEA